MKHRYRIVQYRFSQDMFYVEEEELKFSRAIGDYVKGNWKLISAPYSSDGYEMNIDGGFFSIKDAKDFIEKIKLEKIESLKWPKIIEIIED